MRRAREEDADLFDALAQGSLWPVLGFLLLVALGARATRPRTIRRRQLYIAPSVFLFLSVNQLLHTYPATAGALLAWGGAALLAAIGGWRLAGRAAIAVDRRAGRIALPGSWLALLVIVTAFAARFYFAERMAAEPALRTVPLFYTEALAVMGLATGYYLGRAGCFLRRYFATPPAPVLAAE